MRVLKFALTRPMGRVWLKDEDDEIVGARRSLQLSLILFAVAVVLMVGFLWLALR